MEFPFGQDPNTRDCGFRCLYYVLKPNLTYQEWLKTLLHKNPAEEGLPWGNVISHLRGQGRSIECLCISEEHTFIVYSSKWLPTCGHYLVYDHGVVYDSVDTEPRRYALEDFRAKSGVYTGLMIRPL